MTSFNDNDNDNEEDAAKDGKKMHHQKSNTTILYNMFTIHFSPVTLALPACQPGWEEMENLRGNNSE